MRRLLVLLLVLAAGLSVGVSAQELRSTVVPRQDAPSFVGYVEGQIIVRFQDLHAKNAGVSPATGVAESGIASIDALAARFGVTAIEPLFPGAKARRINGQPFDLSTWHRITFDASLDLEAVMAAYRDDPSVAAVEPIGIHTTLATPNDGYYANQWHLNSASDHDIDAPEAWNIETGYAGVITAVLDTGVRYFHKDLGGANASYANPTAVDGNMWINVTEKNGTAGVDDDGNGYVDDWVGYDFVTGVTGCWSGEDCSTADNDPRDFNGHGTHCAGNLAAINNNAYATCASAGGWLGGAQQPAGNGVKVMACRIGWSGSYLGQEAGYVRMDFAAQAFYYAADNGARVASCSWGSSNSGGVAAAIDYFVAAGGLIFKAAGNDGSQTADYICGRADVISVSALDSGDCKASWSTYGTWVDVSAPGVGIYSLYHDHTAPANDYVASMDGTSMATPIAADVAALIWSRHPDWTAAQVRGRLQATCDPVDGLSCNASYAGKLGAGRVNAYAAVNDGCVAPVAAFSGTPVSGYAPLTVAFTDQSTNGPTSWAWDFGDGGTSTAQNPAHTYTGAGTYTVTLTATNACGSDGETKTGYITVSPCVAPIAAFAGAPLSGTAPLTVSFTDQSTGSPTSWAWTFGDGGTSTARNPSHTYTSAGAYTVTLSATNACGSDDEAKTDYVTVSPCIAPVAAFVGTPTSGTAPLTVQFTDQSTGTPTAWAWTFGDGGTSTAQNPSHTYTAAGTFAVTLTVTNACGSDDEAKAGYVTTTAPPQQCDDFADGSITNWLNRLGTWTATGGYMKGNSNTSDARITSPFGSFTTATINADVRMNSGRTGRNARIIFAYVDGSNYRFVEGDDVNNRWRIYQRVRGRNSYVATSSRTINTAQWYHVQVAAAADGNVTLSVDNVSVATYKFSAAVAGAVGCGFNKANSDFDNFCVSTTVTLGEPLAESPIALKAVPAANVLSAWNRPNPFRGSTTIGFTLPAPAHVTLEVFDVLGRRVRLLMDDNAAAGTQTFEWNGRRDDGSRAGAGVYFYRLNVDGKQMLRRMTLLE